MKVELVKCPNCSQPVQQKVKDRMFLCQTCGSMHLRNSTGIHNVPFEVAAPRGPASRLVYMPFWRLYSDFQIHSRDVQGGFLHKMVTAFKGGDWGDRYPFYVPAIDVDTASFRHWAVMLTTNPPRYNLANGFGAGYRLPTTVTADEAVELADFIAVTIEAEKPGVMQKLNYSLRVMDTKLVYLPFSDNNGTLSLNL